MSLRRCLYFSAAALAALGLAGCGTITSLPDHGGGKRLAIEQELVAATARAAVKDVDFTLLKGQAVTLHVIGMGDEGSQSWRGEPFAVAFDPDEYPAQTPGDAASVQKPRDFGFLSGVLREGLMLSGARVTDPAQAGIDVYVTVDVFGTIRSHHEWILINHRTLTARTAFAVTAFDRRTGEVVLPPQVVGRDAVYREKFVLWMGPYQAVKTVQPSEGPLVDFTDMGDTAPVVRKYVARPMQNPESTPWKGQTCARMAAPPAVTAGSSCAPMDMNMDMNNGDMSGDLKDKTPVSE